MLHFLSLLTDSRGNLTAFSINRCVAATSSSTLRAANFSPATLKKIHFLGSRWHASPACTQPSHPRSCFLKAVFSPALSVSRGWESGVVGTGQAITSRAQSQNSPLPFSSEKGKFLLGSLRWRPHKSLSLSCWVCFYRDVPGPLLSQLCSHVKETHPPGTSPWDSGLSDPAVGLLLQLTSSWDPRAETCTSLQRNSSCHLMHRWNCKAEGPR